MPEIVAALGGSEFVDGVADAIPERFADTFGVFSQQGFQFGERQFMEASSETQDPGCKVAGTPALLQPG